MSVLFSCSAAISEGWKRPAVRPRGGWVSSSPCSEVRASSLDIGIDEMKELVHREEEQPASPSVNGGVELALLPKPPARASKAPSEANAQAPPARRNGSGVAAS